MKSSLVLICLLAAGFAQAEYINVPTYRFHEQVSGSESDPEGRSQSLLKKCNDDLTQKKSLLAAKGKTLLSEVSCHVTKSGGDQSGETWDIDGSFSFL